MRRVIYGNVFVHHEDVLTAMKLALKNEKENRLWEMQ